MSIINYIENRGTKTTANSNKNTVITVNPLELSSPTTIPSFSKIFSSLSANPQRTQTALYSFSSLHISETKQKKQGNLLLLWPKFFPPLLFLCYARYTNSLTTARLPVYRFVKITSI